VKIALASDIHLEFADLILKNEENAEVLILSGDICTAKVFKHKPKERLMVKDFFKRCAFQFPHVVYIMGNHEHYDFDIAKTYDRLKAELADLPNIHVLEKETWEHNGVTFVAGTLWTDMNKGDSLTMWHCGKAMNDFKVITNSNHMVQHKRNVYLASDLSEFIMDRPQIKLWTHGHMHDPSDYLVEETRVVCNPRGYVGYEQRAKEFKLRYLEI